MKKYILLILIICYNITYAQEKEVMKSFSLRVHETQHLTNSTIKEALKLQLNIPKDYELYSKTTTSVKDIDELGFRHERYVQYYKGIKIENSDIRIHYKNDSVIAANGDYIDASNIDIAVVLSKEEAMQIPMTFSKSHTDL